MLDCCRLHVAWDMVNFRFCLLTIIMRQTLVLVLKDQESRQNRSAGGEGGQCVGLVGNETKV